MKKILVPTDFSNNSRHAIRIAAGIAQKVKGRLELLHANTAVAYAPPLPDYYVPEAYDMSEYYENAAEELYTIKRELGDSGKYDDVRFETVVEEGFLYSTVRRIAEEDRADLIIMGTKGATGTTEFFVGSNTEKVIRTAPCPVLAVPENAGAFDLKKVIFPTTLRKDQEVVFQTLAEWQKAYPFEVKILYLNNPGGFETNDEIEKAITGFTEAVGLKNASPYISGNTFNEEASILQFANQENADLIVMGTHQRQGLSHLLFGSLTEDTANHSDIPVLSVPIR
ncbi:MAG: universal stress protein [Lewinellaceae bacterium]|nr:universal stress protein [Saprospiraceae bacterium]MCB9317460.1 universal stress protein [Lewinellaceae bacterium]MCB9332229.1 universal stress protein [Lewinellaceae bacterium]